jgi:PAS domain S-box-containing protein
MQPAGANSTPAHFSPAEGGSRGFSSKWKAQAGFAFALVCLGAVGIASYQSVNQVRDAADWSRHTEEVISSVRLLLSHVTDAETSERGYTIVGETIFLAPLYVARDKAYADLRTLRRLTADNAAQQNRLDAMEPLVAKRMSRLDTVVELRRSQGFAAAQALIATGGGRMLHDQIRRLAAEMEAVEQGLLQQRQVETARKSVIARTIIVGGTILALGVVAVAFVAAGRDFSRRRAHAAQAALAGRLGRIGAWTVTLPDYGQEWSDETCAIHEVPAGFTPTVEQGVNFYAPECRETIKEAFAACARDGTPFDLELAIDTAKGRRIWVRSIGEAERSAAGVIRRVQGAIQDISERKRMDENARQLAAIVENSADAIVSTGVNGNVTSWNPAAEEMFGYTAAEIVGHPFQVLIAPDQADQEAQIRGSIARGGPARQFESTRIRKNGQSFDVFATISPIKDFTGKFLGVSRIIRDITGRKRDLEALRESEMRFRELAENIEEVFWVANADETRKLYISPAYEKIWGRTCQSAYESPHLWLESIRVEDRERVTQALRNKQTRGTFDVEYRIMRPDGEERWIRDRAFPVRDSAGAIKRWVGVAEDNTGQRLVEAQFQQAQKMEAIGTLAGGIAHDFNNILGAINGYTELARLVLTGNPEVREYLGAVMQASNRAANLVLQILTFSRPEQSERQPIQLGAVMTEALTLLRAAVPSTIEFDTSLAEDAPTVLADTTQIHQILMNLGTNAWHAMKNKAGTLQMKLERWVVDAAQVATHARLQSGIYARVSVGDSGCGMDQATLRRIFEPFFTTKPPGEGTGLGLALVHGIMDAHDGAVTVDSQPGKGTMFRLYFPACAAEPVVIPADDGATPTGQGESILFVDDEEMLVRLGERTLVKLGYTVEVATNPAAALALVQADPQRFDVVLTDQTMPGMTGFQLAAELHLIRPGLPVIMMTGYGVGLLAERVAAAGICQLLVKPTSIHTMGVAVHAALAPQLVG